jgi:hypothetical protein
MCTVRTLLVQDLEAVSLCGGVSCAYCKDIVAYLKKGVTKAEIDKLVKKSYPDASVTDMTLWMG